MIFLKPRVYFYAHLSDDDMRDLESGYLTLDVLESSMAMKAKQARTGREEEKGLLRF